MQNPEDSPACFSPEQDAGDSAEEALRDDEFADHTVID